MDRLGRVEIETSDEDAECGEKAASWWVEQIDAPLDCCSQGLMVGDGVAVVDSEETESVVEAISDLLEAERGDACGGEFERQRDTVESAADRADQMDISGFELESCIGAADAIDEQATTRTGEDLTERRGLVGDRERLEVHDHFAGDPQWFAAGCDDVNVLGAGER